jgi:hypothetical protein
MRKLREDQQVKEHKFICELDSVKVSHQSELALIQEKIQSALGKKVNEISALSEELRIREIKIVKLQEMLEKQRKELLK